MTVASLLAELGYRLAQPQADELRRRVLDDDRAGALAVLTDARFSDAEAGAMYDALRVQFKGQPVAFTELPAGHEPVKDARYLVRYGMAIFSAKPYFRDDGHVWCMMHDGDLVKWANLDQVWAIVPKP